MDSDKLKRLAAVKRAKLQFLETEFVLACENAASRKCKRRQLPPDQSKWNRSAWNSYLAEAIQCNLRLGPKLSAIHEETEKLECNLASSSHRVKHAMRDLAAEPPAYSIQH